MAFAPGQFITAQRLNRLQPRTYWQSASGTFAASQTAQDIAGTSIPLTIETDGATVSFTWAIGAYATASLASNINARVIIGADSAPVYAIAEWKDAAAKGSVAQTWSTTIATAGAYTAKLQATTPANGTISVYTSLLVVVTEVA